jgi:hypothetical protein
VRTIEMKGTLGLLAGIALLSGCGQVPAPSSQTVKSGAAELRLTVTNPELQVVIEDSQTTVTLHYRDALSITVHRGSRIQINFVTHNSLSWDLPYQADPGAVSGAVSPSSWRAPLILVTSSKGYNGDFTAVYEAKSLGRTSVVTAVPCAPPGCLAYPFLITIVVIN